MRKLGEKRINTEENMQNKNLENIIRDDSWSQILDFRPHLGIIIKTKQLLIVIWFLRFPIHVLIYHQT